ncbi:class I SAM-dependent methyltransferase [Kribbella sindirgiensis]|uniref:Class I SAM-dependent methyltransferase n=1 Tax=Kribbella sindirgiensis TaxID=1124744 RepID=A0A4R0IXJ8_9ACTN|nr:class I SAM-dependent methyltransferase [Kribbella sindirgiensis]TCC33535.1 class I SAM-dependent methyltransferase [Kribbella sindirgiensis]
MTDSVACRLCGEPLTRTFVDLGMSPPCESFLRADQIDSGETFYPLNVRICDNCLLVQLPAYVAADDVFSDYLYFSSYSTSWVEHARRFVVDMQERLKLDEKSLIVEAASNDGYLLQHAVAEGIPVLGIEPAANIAKIANEKGIRTESYFLGEDTGKDAASRHGQADLVVGNNVFAHVPDIVDFAKGLRALVKDDGLVSLEFPHLLRLIENRQYDTIYHEHYSYLSLKTAADALARAGLKVVDVQELQSHGGSLRVFSTPAETAGEPTELVGKVLQDEEDAGLHSVEGHLGFAAEVFKIKSDLLEFLIQAQRDGKFVAGYGAPGKGNTLLNHCGIREDLLPYTVDRSPHKHGMFLPGTHIPIHAPERLAETRPDYIVILPWNLRAEIVHQLGYAREWGAKFVVPIPHLEVI